MHSKCYVSKKAKTSYTLKWDFLRREGQKKTLAALALFDSRLIK